MKASRFKSFPIAGFSLIEVTIALAIVSFGLLSILGAYASLQSRSGDSNMRDDAILGVNSIRNHLQGEKEFEEIFNEIKEGTLQLIFFNYRGVEPDQPDSLAQNLFSYCDDLDSDFTDWVNARDGQIFIALFELDETANPVGSDELGADANEYEHGSIALQLSLFDIYEPSQALNSVEGRQPVLKTTLVITR